MKFLFDQIYFALVSFIKSWLPILLMNDIIGNCNTVRFIFSFTACCFHIKKYSLCTQKFIYIYNYIITYTIYIFNIIK